MERNLAQKVVAELLQKNGPQLKLEEAMKMGEIPSSDAALKVYALQKGDVTFLAWVTNYEPRRVIVKVTCW